jgi:hypothetical protein
MAQSNFKMNPSDKMAEQPRKRKLEDKVGETIDSKQPTMELKVTPTFKMAFAAARKKFIVGGGKKEDYVFTWKGNKYNVLRADDKGKSNSDKKKSLMAQISSMKEGGKKPRGAYMGGMMSTKERKINPTTGMSMNKGGMTDMRKTGMFYGGGMARRRMK